MGGTGNFGYDFVTTLFGRKEQSGSMNQYQAWLRKQVVQNAVGVSQINGEWKLPQGLTPTEEAVIKNAYYEKQDRAAKELWERDKRKVELAQKASNHLLDVYKTSGFSDQAKKHLMSSYKQFYSDSLGDAYKDSGLDATFEAFERAVDDAGRKEALDQADINALSSASLKYMMTRDPMDLFNYTKIYNRNPKLAEEYSYANPQDLETQHKSNRAAEIELERKKAEQKALEGNQTRSVIKTYGENDIFPARTVTEEKYKNGVRTDVNVLSKPEPETEKERERRLLIEGAPKLEEKIKQAGPDAVYADGFRMNDDGTLYRDPIGGSPQKLPTFDEKMGKKGSVEKARIVGEAWRDAKEILELLEDPEVKKDFEALKGGGFWSQIAGKTVNSARKFLVKKGFSPSSQKTMEVLQRIETLGVKTRHENAGTAMTEIELGNLRPTMPDASDSLDLMIDKISTLAKEGEQEFTTMLDFYKDSANMSPFYKAFGISRFNKPGTAPDQTTDAQAEQPYSDNISEEAKSLIEQYGKKSTAN